MPFLPPNKYPWRRPLSESDTLSYVIHKVVRHQRVDMRTNRYKNVKGSQWSRKGNGRPGSCIQ